MRMPTPSSRRRAVTSVIWVAAFFVFGVVVAIAAVIVVREAGRMTKEPPPVLFSMDEAFDYVVENVPDEVAATLTPDDVRRILAFQSEYFKTEGCVDERSKSAHPPRRASIVGGPETVAYILERAAATGEAYIPEQVYPVIETQLEYLRAIGAVSTPADDAGRRIPLTPIRTADPDAETGA